MLTIPKAAKKFGFPYQTLLRLVNENEIVSLDIPGRRTKMLDPDDVQAFIDRSKSGSIRGSEAKKQPSQVAPNQESQKASRKRQISRKSNLDYVFARGRKSCS